MKKNKNKKYKGLIAVVAGVLTVCLTVTAVFCYKHFTRVGIHSTGIHETVNFLPEKLNGIGYFSDGNLYSFSNGTSALIAQNVYDTQSDTPLYTADYAIDKESGNIIYTSGGELYFYNGTATHIASGVSAWRTAKGMQAVAFITPWNKNDQLGALFLYQGQTPVLIDMGVTPSTVRFSQSGNAVFYEKPNSYPKTRSSLYRLTLDGVTQKIWEESFPVMWVNNEGTAVITGESVDDGLYTYRVFGKNLKKQVLLNNVYYSQVSQDQSILYLLMDYDYDLKHGTLMALDLTTLRMKQLAQQVSFFNPDAVTDNSKGVVYSTLTDTENEFYSIYYAPLSGKSIRLIRNTTEDALYTVAINSTLNSGYLLSYGLTANDGGVYSIKWKNGTLEAERLISGHLDSLVYYEATNTVTFIRNPANGKAQLYRADLSGNVTKLCDDCGVEYYSSNQTYAAQAVVANSGDSVMYFTDIVIGTTGLETSGTLKLYKNGTSTVLAENVSSSYLEAPVTDGALNQIYYLAKTETGMDLYFYNGTHTLIKENVHGIIELN